MKPKLKLTGQDGNAILGKARQAAKKAGWARTDATTAPSASPSGWREIIIIFFT